VLVGIGKVAQECHSRYSVRLMPDRLADFSIGVGLMVLIAAGVAGLITGWRLTTALSVEFQAARLFWKNTNLPAPASMVILKPRG